MHRLFFIILFSVIGQNLSALEPSKQQAMYNYTETSDDYILKSTLLGYESNRRNLDWPYKDASAEAIDFGFNFQQQNLELPANNLQGNRLAFFTAKKFSPFKYLKIEGAHHNVNSKNNIEESRTSFLVDFKFKSFKYGDFNFLYSDDYLYQQMVLPDGADKYLVGREFSVSHLFTGMEKFRFRTTLKNTNYSDHNKSSYFDTEAKYHLGQKYQWIWLGFGFNYLEFSDEVIGYWTPEKFLSYGLRFELSSHTYHNFSVGTGGSLNINQENDQEKGEGHYINSYLQYGDRNDWHLRLEYESIKSSQENQEWKSDRYSLNITGYL